jgi:hypothetical protein
MPYQRLTLEALSARDYAQPSRGVRCSHSMHPVRLPPCCAVRHDPAGANDHRTCHASSTCGGDRQFKSAEYASAFALRASADRSLFYALFQLPLQLASHHDVLPPIAVAATAACPLQLNPVLGPDPGHARELAYIVGGDDQPFAASMTADLHVVRTAGRSRSLQFRSNLSVMRGRLVSKG